MAKIRVNKLEATQRQIDAAIRLLFNNEDPVAIHSVAAAGCRILRDIAEKNDTQLWQMMNECVRPEMRKQFFSGVLNKLTNFLKHADHNPDETIDGVDETINDLTIFLACLLYNDLRHQWTPEMRNFVIWYSGINPSHIRNDLPWSAELRNATNYWRDRPRHEQLAIGKEMLDMCNRLTK